MIKSDFKIFIKIRDSNFTLSVKIKKIAILKILYSSNPLILNLIERFVNFSSVGIPKSEANDKIKTFIQLAVENQPPDINIRHEKRCLVIDLKKLDGFFNSIY